MVPAVNSLKSLVVWKETPAGPAFGDALVGYSAEKMIAKSYERFLAVNRDGPCGA